MPTKFAKWAQQVLDEYGEYCVFCGKPSGAPHHFFAKGQYPKLSYTVKNGVPICLDCHTKIEGEHRKEMEQRIIDRRGKEWYNNLVDKITKQNRPPKKVVNQKK